MFPIFTLGRKRQKDSNSEASGNENNKKKESQEAYEGEKRKRKYNEAWRKDFPWHDVETRDDGTELLYCVLCRNQTGRKGGGALGRAKNEMVEGSSVLKRYTLVRHETTQAHAICAERERAMTAPIEQSEAVRALLTLEEDVAARVRILIRNTHALCKNGRPFTDFSWLCQLHEINGVDLGSTYRNDKACRMFAHSIAEVERDKLKSKVLHAKFVSVICDGSTDSATREQEIIYIKHATAGQTYTDVIGVRRLEKGDAAGIVTEIYSAFRENLALEPEGWLSKLAGFSSDGAPVMMGRVSGVAARLKNLRPNLISVHCAAHRLELVFKDAIKNNLFLTKVSTLLLNIYLFYKGR